MTRDEALAKLRAVVEKHDLYIGERSVEASLDGYVALGLIKLDDTPPTLWELLRKHGIDPATAQFICNEAMARGCRTPQESGHG